MIDTSWRTPQELRGYRLHKTVVFTTRKVRNISVVTCYFLPY